MSGEINRGCDGADARAAYRARAWNARDAHPQHADTIGSVLSESSSVQQDEAATQLAADLSGRYGPFSVRFAGSHSGAAVSVNGLIYDSDDHNVGAVARRFTRDPENNEIVVHHDYLALDLGARRRHFARALQHALEPYYRRSGAGRIELLATDDGSYVWAIQGYEWDPSPDRLQRSLANVRTAADRLRPASTHADRLLLDIIIESLDPEVDDLPSPADLANQSTGDTPNLGETLMRGADWWGVRYL
jgi:hypothetical protein